ncbi:5-methyltetrahydropteroyltriglutamate--homocysteine methyltransferase [Roseimicrobium gellanilyticum]|uniref:5-methyltetrahydropteroyltriglutamate--homocysteine methyltransferase n=1 Tax=Roseimicrobium gellanilyticum TaxID=748857 RepID=A0A366HVE4_9BACT|nr:cobalamin-independent methionine synthase II family protein [Roseimicrobium gellanilyticum]RBP48251.1 5-methyltetrahydropteroyltriglutamate--homocysteine methyltransferase [Roseimicrobium gellanilyticum]
MGTPALLTTTVGSYPVPDWLPALPSSQALLDATRVVFDIQREAGIDLPTDGELYRFDINHPDTNGMIDYFTGKLGGISPAGRPETEAFRAKHEMKFRAKPAGVVREAITEGVMNLPEDCARAAAVARGDFKFTLTSPYMLARTLLDKHYHDFAALTLSIANALAAQVSSLNATCIQVDEANIPGNPADAPLAAQAINRVLDAVPKCVQRAVHLCFGNYGGQTVQRGTWEALLAFLNDLHADHVVLELAHRPSSDLDALKELAPHVGIGVGVVDIKVNHVETADEIAGRIDAAAKKLGAERLKYIHPDCGFWMLKRSVADRKMAALAQGRERYLRS